MRHSRTAFQVLPAGAAPSVHRGFRAFRPPPRIGVIGNLAVENLLVVVSLLVHVRRRRLCLLYAPVGPLALLEDDLVARLQILPRFGLVAQVAVLLNVLDGYPASLQTSDAMSEARAYYKRRSIYDLVRAAVLRMI